MGPEESRRGLKNPCDFDELENSGVYSSAKKANFIYFRKINHLFPLPTSLRLSFLKELRALGTGPTKLPSEIGDICMYKKCLTFSEAVRISPSRFHFS